MDHCLFVCVCLLLIAFLLFINISF